MKEARLDRSHSDKSLSELMGQVEAMMLDLARGTEPARLGEIISEHLASGGKRLRAHLALKSLEAMGALPRIGLGWAAACELLHNATLIHDDLQDGDTHRRGHQTVWAKHGAPQAINAGDLMLMLPYRAVDRIPVDSKVKWELAKCLAQYSERMVRGQSRELDLINRLDSENLVDDYKAVSIGKTSSLFELPVYGAAVMLGLNIQRSLGLAREFSRIGLVFQMVDDLLDLLGKKGRLQRGEDLREGKVTCAVAVHLKNVEGDRAALREFLGRDRASVTAAEIEDWIWKFEEQGTLLAVSEEVFQMARDFQSSPILRELPALHREGCLLLEKILDPLEDLRKEVMYGV